MPKKTDNPIGLFRLEDLEGMEVENKALFPGPPKEPPRTLSPVTTSTDQMVDLIRRARTLHTAGPGTPDEAAEPKTAEEPVPSAEAEAPVKEEQEKPAPVVGPAVGATKFDTAEIRAVIRAAEKEVAKRGHIRSLLWLAPVGLLVLGGLGALLILILLHPPPMLEGSFPVQLPALSSEASDLAMIEVSMIPTPPPPAAPEPETPPPRPRRDRNRDRDRRPAIDTRNLF